MKYLLAIFLITTLIANSYAASGFCMVEHENTSIESQSMPCHESKQEQSNTVKLHLCDCEMSSPFIYTFVLNVSSIPIVSDIYFNKIQHYLLTISFKYRPPKYFHG